MDLRNAQVGSGPSDRARIAYHEAGHAVAAVMLGGRVTGPVSIEPTKRWLGVAFTRPPGFSRRESERVPLELPLATWPARVRRSFEVDALISLAGPAAEAMRPERLSGYIPSSRHADDRRAAEATTVLTSRDRRLLASGNGPEDDPRPWDDKRAVDASVAAAGTRGGLLLEFLRAEAYDLVPWRTTPESTRWARLAKGCG
jgi:hypothetical protein